MYPRNFYLNLRLPSIVITVLVVFYSRIKVDKQINVDHIFCNQGLKQKKKKTDKREPYRL